MFLVPPTKLYHPPNDAVLDGTDMDDSMMEIDPPVPSPPASEPQTPQEETPQEETPREETPQKETPQKETQHTEPKWLEKLQLNFKTEIVDKCSEKTRNAVELNEKIQVCF